MHVCTIYDLERDVDKQCGCIKGHWYNSETDSVIESTNSTK